MIHRSTRKDGRRRPCVAGWLVMLCMAYAWVGMTAGAAETKYLALSAIFTGEGEYPMPDDDLTNTKQKWTLTHGYMGTIEVVIQETETNPPPNRRTRWVITPADSGGGTNRIYGFIRDTAMNGFEEGGAGGSGAEHSGKEVWTAGAHVDAEELGFELTIEPEERIWGAHFAPGAAERLLLEKLNYTGEAGRKPKQNGFGDGWSFQTGNPKEKGWAPSSGDAEARGVSTRYHPRDSVTLMGEITNRRMITGGTNFASVSPSSIPVVAQLPGKGTIQLTLAWTLMDAFPEVELVVRSPRYWKWLPTLLPNDAPGEPLAFTATVESPKGEDLSLIHVDHIRWTLVDTSQEPGVCLNYPAHALKFDTGIPDLTLKGIPTDEKHQVGNEPEPDSKRSRVEIEPNDWGGWSVLRVEAKLADGRVLKGRLEAPPDPEGEYDIRLPLRNADSKIGRVWLQEQGISNPSDEDDDDKLPEGSPGIDGDGFSLYEEYRGFQVRRAHIRTNPKAKDLFIQNMAGPPGEGPIRKFTQLSGLTVHLPAFDEYDPKGNGFIVNRIRKAGPTRGPQSGLLLVKGGFRRLNDFIPPGTRPKDNIPIRVPENPGMLNRGSVSAQTAQDHMVLQALFQSVAVQRPGPTDSDWTFLHKTQPAGSSQPPEFVRKRTRFDTEEEPVVVLDLAGNDLAVLWNARARRQLESELKKIPPGTTGTAREVRESLARRHSVEHRWLVGEQGGAHSGPEECIMRDWFAEAHESALSGFGGRKVFRYIDPKARLEKPGKKLGTTSEGTGINRLGHSPEPRYGPRSFPGPANQQLAVADHL